MKKQRIATIFIGDVDEVKMYYENSTFTTLYKRADKDTFEIIYYDTDEDICAICGGGENVDHDNCTDFSVITEKELIDSVDAVFNEEGGIIEINGIRYIKKTN